VGETLVITFAGTLLGIVMTFPVAKIFSNALGAYFPVFNVAPSTFLLDLAAALIVGIAAALIPTRQAIAIRIADGLRRIG
jgi:putative ABC transport system permease protein